MSQELSGPTMAGPHKKVYKSKCQLCTVVTGTFPNTQMLSHVDCTNCTLNVLLEEKEEDEYICRGMNRISHDMIMTMNMTVEDGFYQAPLGDRYYKNKSVYKLETSTDGMQGLDELGSKAEDDVFEMNGDE